MLANEDWCAGLSGSGVWPEAMCGRGRSWGLGDEVVEQGGVSLVGVGGWRGQHGWRWGSEVVRCLP